MAISHSYASDYLAMIQSISNSLKKTNKLPYEDIFFCLTRPFPLVITNIAIVKATIVKRKQFPTHSRWLLKEKRHDLVEYIPLGILMPRLFRFMMFITPRNG